MTSRAEVLDAARRLPIDEQLVLLQELSRALELSNDSEKNASPLGLASDFTQRLQELFHRAKRQALQAESR